MLKSKRRKTLVSLSPLFCYLMNELEINTELYEARHGKRPPYNKKADWHFYVPSQYGKRPWLFVDMTLAKAKKEIEQKAKNGGVFKLAP